MAMWATARRALACEREAAQLEAQIDALVRRIAPALLDQLVVVPVVAAQVVVSWSHRARVRSEAAFAQLGGLAPIEASSGTVVRHRLNRSGDRQLNSALHTIVMVRIRQGRGDEDLHEATARIGQEHPGGQALPQALRGPPTLPPARGDAVNGLTGHRSVPLAALEN
jgi:transposase